MSAVLMVEATDSSQRNSVCPSPCCCCCCVREAALPPPEAAELDQQEIRMRPMACIDTCPVCRTRIDCVVDAAGPSHDVRARSLRAYGRDPTCASVNSVTVSIEDLGMCKANGSTRAQPRPSWCSTDGKSLGIPLSQQCIALLHTGWR